MKIFIFNHIKENNNILTDSWPSYILLDSPEVNYIHEIHRHGKNGNFLLGQHSTLYIEGVWVTIKSYIKKIYHYIPSENFILFLREVEIRYIIRN